MNRMIWKAFLLIYKPQPNRKGFTLKIVKLGPIDKGQSESDICLVITEFQLY